jgi:hypothetical protein
MNIDYLFKFIVIGPHISPLSLTRSRAETIQGKQELENHACCIIASMRPVSVTLPSLPPTSLSLVFDRRLIYTVKEHSAHTIGVEFSSRTLRIEDRNIKLQVCTYPLGNPRRGGDKTKR